MWGFVCAWVYTYMHVCVDVWAYTCMHVCVDVWAYTCMHVCVRVWVRASERASFLCVPTMSE